MIRLRRLGIGVVIFGGGDGGGGGGLAWERALLEVVSAIAAIAAAGPVEARPVLCGHPSWCLLAALVPSALRHMGATFGWVAVVTGGEGGDGAVEFDLVDSQRHGWVWVGGLWRLWSWRRREGAYGCGIGEIG